MAYSQLEQQLVNNYMDVNYPLPEPEQPMEDVQLAAGPSPVVSDAGAAFGVYPGMGKRSQKSDIGEKMITGAPDFAAGGARGFATSALGIGGDVQKMYRFINALATDNEGGSILDKFGRAAKTMEDPTFLPSSEDLSKGGYTIPGTNITLPALPAAVPPGTSALGMTPEERQKAAEAGQFVGELVGDPVALVKGGKAALSLAKKLPKDLPVGLSIKVLGDPVPVDKVQRQKNYKTWAEGADVKADDGKPKTLYHATTHDFDTFSLERANPENHYGKAFYLTDSVDDANANYAGVGPDLKQRIELRSERLADEFADMDEQDVMDSIQSAGVDMNKYFAGGKTFADLDSKQTNEVLMAVAESELKGHEGMVMPVFAKMKNPVKVGTKDETVFSIETQLDEAGDVVDESGNGIDLINAIREVADEYNLSDRDIDRAMSSITEQMYDGIKAGEVDRILRNEINDVYTPDGEYASPGQFIADVFQRMGFDGIEMNAEKYFGPRQGAFGTKLTGMEGVKGATHYILFDSRNIKSAIGNNGKFDPKDPNILQGVAIGGPAAGTAATMQDKEKK